MHGQRLGLGVDLGEGRGVSNLIICCAGVEIEPAGPEAAEDRLDHCCVPLLLKEHCTFSLECHLVHLNKDLRQLLVANVRTGLEVMLS